MKCQMKYDAIIQSMTELKELEKWKEKSSFWQIWITLARPIFRLFATHTLGTAGLEGQRIQSVLHYTSIKWRDIWSIWCKRVLAKVGSYSTSNADRILLTCSWI